MPHIPHSNCNQGVTRIKTEAHEFVCFTVYVQNTLKMANPTDKKKAGISCNYCEYIFKSTAGLQNHMNRKHPLDVTSVYIVTHVISLLPRERYYTNITRLFCTKLISKKPKKT